MDAVTMLNLLNNLSSKKNGNSDADTASKLFEAIGKGDGAYGSGGDISRLLGLLGKGGGDISRFFELIGSGAPKNMSGIFNTPFGGEGERTESQNDGEKICKTNGRRESQNDGGKNHKTDGWQERQSGGGTAAKNDNLKRGVNMRNNEYETYNAGGGRNTAYRAVPDRARGGQTQNGGAYGNADSNGDAYAARGNGGAYTNYDRESFAARHYGTEPPHADGKTANIDERRDSGADLQYINTAPKYKTARKRNNIRYKEKE
ncbi:MAG: hypothetical protein LBP79_01960 [Clostridiales bacterium]|nr:hypothetical protein [Clostridiales bacterium]